MILPILPILLLSFTEAAPTGNRLPIINYNQPPSTHCENATILEECIKFYVPLYLAAQVSHTMRLNKSNKAGNSTDSIPALSRKYYPQASLSIVPDRFESHSESPKPERVLLSETKTEIDVIPDEKLPIAKQEQTISIEDQDLLNIISTGNSQDAYNPFSEIKHGSISDSESDLISHQEEHQEEHSDTLHSEDQYSTIEEEVDIEDIQDIHNESFTEHINQYTSEPPSLPQLTKSTTEPKRTYYGYMAHQYTHYSLSRAISEQKRHLHILQQLSQTIKNSLLTSTYPIEAQTKLSGLVDKTLRILGKCVKSVEDEFEVGIGQFGNNVDEMFWGVDKAFNGFYEDVKFHFEMVLKSLKESMKEKFAVQVDIIKSVIEYEKVSGILEVFKGVVEGALSGLKVNQNYAFIGIMGYVKKQIKSFKSRLDGLNFKGVKGESAAQMRDFKSVLEDGLKAWINLEKNLDDIKKSDETMNDTEFDAGFRARYNAFLVKSDGVKEKLKRGLSILGDVSRNALYEKRVIVGEVQSMKLEWV